MKYLYEMLIRLTKNTNQPHILKYIRDNGTETWTYGDDFFIQHDISHFALETILAYKTAFNGMVNSGMNLSDFENREKRAFINITDEAWYAENMANLFLTEISQGVFEDFNEVQQQTFQSFNLTYPVITLTDPIIQAIRSYLGLLLLQWKELLPNETLELTFNL